MSGSGSNGDAGSLYNAFLGSKNRSIARLVEQSVLRYPFPWLSTYERRMHDGDPFPFGIGETADLGPIPRYTYEQGIAHRHAKIEESFPPGMMVSVHS